MGKKASSCDPLIYELFEFNIYKCCFIEQNMHNFVWINNLRSTWPNIIQMPFFNFLDNLH